jgi:hypothetical protein
VVGDLHVAEQAPDLELDLAAVTRGTAIRQSPGRLNALSRARLPDGTLTTRSPHPEKGEGFVRAGGRVAAALETDGRVLLA